MSRRAISRDEREAEAGALLARRVERLEQLAARLRRDLLAAVPHRELDRRRRRARATAATAPRRAGRPAAAACTALRARLSSARRSWPRSARDGSAPPASTATAMLGASSRAARPRRAARATATSASSGLRPPRVLEEVVDDALEVAELALDLARRGRAARRRRAARRAGCRRTASCRRAGCAPRARCRRASAACCASRSASCWRMRSIVSAEHAELVARRRPRPARADRRRRSARRRRRAGGCCA